jgi:hypothetical protein
MCGTQNCDRSRNAERWNGIAHRPSCAAGNRSDEDGKEKLVDANLSVADIAISSHHQLGVSPFHIATQQKCLWTTCANASTKGLCEPRNNRFDLSAM